MEWDVGGRYAELRDGVVREMKEIKEDMMAIEMIVSQIPY